MLKLTDGKEIEVTEEVLQVVTEILRGLFCSVSDNFVIWNKEVFGETYLKAKNLYFCGKID